MSKLKGFTETGRPWVMDKTLVSVINIGAKQEY